jgi:hypothetical protein
MRLVAAYSVRPFLVRGERAECRKRGAALARERDGSEILFQSGPGKSDHRVALRLDTGRFRSAKGRHEDVVRMVALENLEPDAFDPRFDGGCDRAAARLLEHGDDLFTRVLRLHSIEERQTDLLGIALAESSSHLTSIC